MSLRSCFRTGLDEVRAEMRPAPLVQDGRFNRTGIMREAVRLARQVFRTGSWAARMSAALTAAWRYAREAMADAVEAAAFYAEAMAEAPRTTRAAVSAFRPVRPWQGRTRIFSHGW